MPQNLKDKNLIEKRISVIGMGFVGLTLSLAFSDIGFRVVGVEKRKKVLDSLKQCRPHFYEKGLEEILKRELGKGFKFVNNIEDAISDIYIVAVGTPVDLGKKPDFSSLRKVSEDIGKILKKGDLVILRSTVSPGTTRNFVKPILEDVSGLKAGKDFYISFAPERTVEGNALEEVKKLPQVIGGFEEQSALYTAGLFKKLCSEIIMVNSLEDAEMVKLANNLCRDVNFAFANEFALICDEFNLDANSIIDAANSGYPRNRIAYPSPGVGGYCLTKDPYILTDALVGKKYKPQLLTMARGINEKMPEYVVSQVEKYATSLNKKVSELKIFVLGVAFKGHPETSDIRFSPSVDVINGLKEKGAKNIFCYDSVVDKKTISNLGIFPCGFDAGFKDADCVLIMNNHKDFYSLDILSLLEKAKMKSLFFDAWKVFPPEKIFKIKDIFYSNLGYDNFTTKLANIHESRLKSDDKQFAILNFIQGNGPYCRIAELGIYINRELEKQGRRKLHFIMPLVYGNKQKIILEEELSSYGKEFYDYFYFDEKYGAFLKEAFFNGDNYFKELERFVNRKNIIEANIKKYFLSEKLYVSDFFDNSKTIITGNIVMELNRNPRISTGIRPCYYTSITPQSKLFKNLLEDGIFGEKKATLFIRALNLFEELESRQDLLFLPEPGTFLKSEVNLNKFSLTPPLMAEPVKNIDSLEKGIYINFSGIDKFNFYYKKAIELEKKYKIYTNQKDFFNQATYLLPSAITNKSIVVKIARAGWSSIWLPMLFEKPFITFPYNKNDDPEIYFNLKTIGKIGLGAFWDEDKKFEQALEASQKNLINAKKFKKYLKNEYGTLNGVEYCAKKIVANFNI